MAANSNRLCMEPIGDAIHHRKGKYDKIGAQATTLEVGEQALTDGRVLRRTFPEPEGVLCAVDADPQRDDHTVLADVDTVEQETDQIQLVEGRRLPRGQLRGGLATNRRLTALLLTLRLGMSAGSGSRLRA